MQASETIQLAAAISAQGRDFIEGAERITADKLHRYWSAARTRCDHWAHDLKVFRAPTATGAHVAVRLWSDARAVVREVLLTEALCRTFAALVAARDRRQGVCEHEPIVTSVLGGHEDARGRALRLLVGGGAPAGDAANLNRLRRQVERWSDLLVGQISRWQDVTQFASDPLRAASFADDFRDGGAGRIATQRWQTLAASLSNAFAGFAAETGNAELNGRIASSVIDCFDPARFDPADLAPAFWTFRLESLALHTQTLLAELSTA